jgi:carotenoid cleavage dioxygenase-like enzyme
MTQTESNSPSRVAPQNPYLEGSYAPVDSEDVFSLRVIEGEIPRDLFGLFVRNGPNPHFPPPGRHHWFDGDGMLHSVWFENGQATYRNKWVRTAGFAQEAEAGRALWGGIIESTRDNPKGLPYKDTANTDVRAHRGRLYATWYLSGAPYEVNPRTLETVGPDDFGGKRTTPISAHPKVDPRTNELVFFEYGLRAPFLSYGVVSAAGELVHQIPVALPGARLPHDMAITERFSILMDLPVVVDLAALKERKWRSYFDQEIPARFALIPRHGKADEVRWFEASPCYIYHTVNAYEEGDKVILVACRVEDPIPKPRPEDGAHGAAMANLRVRAKLHRWTFDLVTGKTTEESLDDQNTEFPSMDARFLGAKTRHAWNVIMDVETTARFAGITHFDTETGAQKSLQYGPGRFGSETPFAPRAGAETEGDGYVLSFVHREGDAHSEVWIVDAQNVDKGPVCRLEVPRRVPHGFHACWMPGEELPAV